ncbi:ANTAR domain-containing protein [Streptomyces sp. NPDC005727]|uniref:ANTAR domain-containing protein n=1 Tax=Streptomyces sp. NPDC005727 TaxID=3157053 RepID=UPI0033E9E250
MSMQQRSDHPATRDAAFTVRRVDEKVIVLCLSGALDAPGIAALTGILKEHLATATAGQRLVLDLSGLDLISTAALRILDARTRHLARPVAVVTAAPHVREAFATAPGLRLHATLAAALADPATTGPPDPLPGPQVGPVAGAGAEELQSEVFGLRAKARSHSLIGMAHGVLYERYRLDKPAQGFDLLREASQHHNVPLRVLASAVLTAPPAPSTPGSSWFPGRRHTPPPTLELLSTGGLDTRDRRQVLRIAVNDAITLTDADAVELHLTDPAQDHALVLEGHANLQPAYRDSIALVTAPPALCAQARDRARAVTVTDITTDPTLADSQPGRAALAAGSRALHAEPAVTDTGESTGVITLHQRRPGLWMTNAQHTAPVLSRRPHGG